MSEIYGTCRRHGSGSEETPFTSHLQTPPSLLTHHIHSHASLLTLLTPFTLTQLFQAETLAAPAQKSHQSGPTTLRLEALKDPWQPVFTPQPQIKNHFCKMYFIIFIRTRQCLLPVPRHLCDVTKGPYRLATGLVLAILQAHRRFNKAQGWRQQAHCWQEIANAGPLLLNQ